MLRRIGLCLAVLLVAPAANANPLDTFGFGSRETAMGGAMSAETRGFAAGYYNPAALVRSQGLEIGVGYFRADHDLRINGQSNGVDPVRGLVGGIVVPGEIFELPFAFGLAVHLPDDRISRVRALRQEQPRWELYDNRNQRLFLAANLAIRPFRWLELGGGLSFMSSTRGRLDITGGANLFNPDDSRLRHEVDADLTAVRYPQAGARVVLSDRLALAAVYRGEFQLSLDLGAHLYGDISGITTALYDLRTHSINNFLPQQAVLGGSWQILRDLRGTFDATWVNWSAYKPPVAELDVVLDIPPPGSGWPAGITPPETPAPVPLLGIKMRDRVVPRFGLEWRAVSAREVDGFFRAGYEFAQSPIAAQSGATNYVDRDRHTVSFGLGAAVHSLPKELPGTLRFDVHVQWSELVSGTTFKNNAADLVGDYTAGGRIVNLGATMSFAFDAPKEEAK